MIAILGPNGAGKSSFVKAVLGLIDKMSGSVKFLGLPLKKALPKIAYVSQKEAIDWDFPITVLEVVLMGSCGKCFRRTSAQEKKKALLVLEQVGLLPLIHRPIRNLSGGEQQRLFLARALFQDPDIYFFDEPFSHVDAVTEKLFIQILQTKKKEGKTIFIVHHDLHTVKKYFDWIVLLNTCLVSAGPLETTLTKENLLKTFGKNFIFLADAAKLSEEKSSGWQ
jgi:manganese/zinc/iron transport system ATP- binding protein